MGFIKILRWRIGGALSKLAGRSSGFEIVALQRAALFMDALGEEHASLLFAEMTPEEVRGLRAEIDRLTGLEDVSGQEVLQEFLEGLATNNLPSYVSRDDAEELARAFTRSSPGAVVDRLRYLWLQDEESLLPRDGDDESDLELEFGDLEPAQKAAVFMMWLPPELSAMVLQKFSPQLVHVVTGILVELPFVVPRARELVLAEFMEGVSLGIPGLSVDDVGLPVVVEAFVRSNPEMVAKRLEKKWLGNSAVVVPGQGGEKSPVTLSPLEKAAVFFQSLSLPLSYRLLAHMEESEIESLMETIETLGGVDSETRKAVLQELMLASKGPQMEPQPIHILGPAMGRMIRRRPEVVVNHIRKQWL